MRDGETEGVMSVKRGRLIQVGPLELDWINKCGLLGESLCSGRTKKGFGLTHLKQCVFGFDIFSLIYMQIKFGLPWLAQTQLNPNQPN